MNLDKEILEEFSKESNQLLVDLELVVDKLESWKGDFPDDLFKEFALKVDRIMGASKTLLQLEPTHRGLMEMGKVTEVCKFLGYKACENPNVQGVPVFSAFWADTVDYLKQLLANLETPEKYEDIVSTSGAFLLRRLDWLVNKVKPPSAEQTVALKNIDVEELMKRFGA